MHHQTRHRHNHNHSQRAIIGCRLVLHRYIENIEISIRYRYIVSYRIAGRNIEIFDISRYQISIYHFAEFSFIYSFTPRFDSLSPGISIRSCSLIEPIRHCLYLRNAWLWWFWQYSLVVVCDVVVDVMRVIYVII